jgi:hypothetical protein
MKTRFTCNQFLSCHGNPTAVEAEIGVIYQKDGLEPLSRGFARQWSRCS